MNLTEAILLITWHTQQSGHSGTHGSQAHTAVGAQWHALGHSGSQGTASGTHGSRGAVAHALGHSGTLHAQLGHSAWHRRPFGTRSS